MFFLLSKLLVFLTKPLNWAVALLVASFFLKKRNWRRGCRAATAAILVFFTNPLVINQLALAWEARPVELHELRGPYDYAVVLGGYFGPDFQAPAGCPQFGPAASRFVTPVQLYKTGRVKKLLLTGGSGTLFKKNEASEAGEMLGLLLQMGIPREDILVEGRSRNTRENALFTKELLGKTAPGASCLLVTSAYHMPRARRCFEKAGLRCDTFPVDFLGKPFRWAPSHLVEPDEVAFYKWNALIKEWAGLAAYWARGFV